MKLVLFRDAEFWKGPLHHVRPSIAAYLGQQLFERSTLLTRALLRWISICVWPTRYAVVRPGEYDKVDLYKPYLGRNRRVGQRD